MEQVGKGDNSLAASLKKINPVTVGSLSANLRSIAPSSSQI